MLMHAVCSVSLLSAAGHTNAWMLTQEQKYQVNIGVIANCGLHERIQKCLRVLPFECCGIEFDERSNNGPTNFPRYDPFLAGNGGKHCALTGHAERRLVVLDHFESNM